MPQRLKYRGWASAWLIRSAGSWMIKISASPVGQATFHKRPLTWVPIGIGIPSFFERSGAFRGDENRHRLVVGYGVRHSTVTRGRDPHDIAELLRGQGPFARIMACPDRVNHSMVFPIHDVGGAGPHCGELSRLFRDTISCAEWASIGNFYGAAINSQYPKAMVKSLEIIIGIEWGEGGIIQERQRFGLERLPRVGKGLVGLGRVGHLLGHKSFPTRIPFDLRRVTSIFRMIERSERNLIVRSRMKFCGRCLTGSR